VNSPTTPARAAAGPAGFDLDVRIVEAGPAAAMLLGSTDDGCDTLANGDC